MEDNSSPSIVVEDSNATVDEEPISTITTTDYVSREANREKSTAEELWLDRKLNIKLSNSTGSGVEGLKKRLTAALQHCPLREKIANTTISVAERTNYTYKSSDLKKGDSTEGTITEFKLKDGSFVKLDSNKEAILFLQLWNLFSKQSSNKKAQRTWQTDFQLKVHLNNLYFSVTNNAIFKDIKWTVQADEIQFMSFNIESHQPNPINSTNPRKRRRRNNNSMEFTDGLPFPLQTAPMFTCNTCHTCYSTQYEHTCGHSIDPSYLIDSNLSVNGYNTAYGYYTWSDARFKHSIELLGNSNILDKIEPVTYKLNNDPQQRRVFGLIAQNVEQHLPEAVITNAGGYKGVDYIQFIPLLIRELQIMKERLIHLEDDSSKNFSTNCMRIENIFTTLEHGHKFKMAQISIFESIVLEKQNWTKIERQNLMLKLVFLFPSYVGNFTRKQVHSILKQIQSVTLWAKAETDEMAKLCVGVLLYNSGKRSKAAQQLQQLVKAHDTQTQKMALAYLIAISYSNDNQEDAVKLTNDLQRMLPNDKEKNYYGYQVAMMRVSYLFKQGRVEEIEEAISEWRNMVTVSTKGDSTQYKILHYLPIDIFQAEYQVLCNNYAEAEKILNDCLSSVGDSHHYIPLLKSKLLGVLAKQCKHDEATSLSEELLSTKRTNGNVLGVLSELKNLVNLYYSAKIEWNTTLEDNFNFVVASSDEITEDYWLHRELLELVRDLAKDVSYKLKQRETGIVLLQKFINTLENRSTIDIESKTLAYNDLGVLYNEQRDLKSAEIYFSQCNTSADGCSNIQHKLTSKQNLARLYMDTNEWQKAQQWTCRQLKILDESKDDISDYQGLKYNMLYQLSAIYFEVKNWKMMELCLLDCLKLSNGYFKYPVLQQFTVLYGDKHAWTALGHGYCASRLLELSNQSEVDGQQLFKLITDKKNK